MPTYVNIRNDLPAALHETENPDGSRRPRILRRAPAEEEIGRRSRPGLFLFRPGIFKVADMLSTFTSVEILTPGQCAEVCSTVHMLRSFWTQVHESSQLFTLGVESYI